MDKNLFNNERKVEMLHNELTNMRKLQHNRIVNLYRIYESDNNINLVIDRAPCGTLL